MVAQDLIWLIIITGILYIALRRNWWGIGSMNWRSIHRLVLVFLKHFWLHLLTITALLGLAAFVVAQLTSANPLIWGVVLLLVLYWLFKRKEQRRRQKATLEQLDRMSPYKFESHVADLMESQGFETEVTPGSNDFGVDLIAQRGRKKYAVQVKRYSDNVSRTALSDAVAGKDFYGCNASMVVTNSYFTEGAREFAKHTECELVDRDDLQRWLGQSSSESLVDSALRPLR